MYKVYINLHGTEEEVKPSFIFYIIGDKSYIMKYWKKECS